jgi:PAS domain S-box-containing protein
MMIISEGIKSQVPKRIGLLLVLASLLAIVVLYALDISFLYEPKHLLGITNTIFTALIPIIVAFFAARTYRKTGSFSVLLMGCGMLGFGLCAGSAGWLREMHGGANINVTLYNTGALLGSLCHFSGAVINYSRRSSARELERQKLAVIPAYAAIIVFAVLLSFATVQRVVPPFFIQGSGPTALRQIVLGSSIFLYGLSSLFFLNNYLRSKSDFLYWYSLCLAMLALGLFAFYIQRIVGSPIGWVGRTSNYVGTIFALMAILAAVRSGKSKGLPLEEVISGFFVDAEANYKTLVETASDAIISFDQENRIILWNSSAERIFGYAKEEATGLPLLGVLIPEEQANTLKELIESTRYPGSPNTIEMAGRHKNGGLFPIELSAFGRKLPNGWVNTLILRDITERKRVDVELRENQSRLDLALRSAHMGVWYMDLIENKRHFDDQVCHLLGIDPAKFTGAAEQFYEAVHPDDREKIKTELARAIEQDVPYETEYRAVWPDGSVHHIIARSKLFHDALGRPARINGLIWDITEGKQAEKALRESEAKYRDLFENMAEEVHYWRLVRDETGRIRTWRLVDANPPTLRTWGRISLDEIKGKTTDEIFGPGSTDHYLPVVQKIMTEGVPYSYEDYFPNLDKYFRFTSVPLGEYFITTGADITGIKKADQVLKRAHDELEVRVQERTAELAQSNKELTIEIAERRKMEQALVESKEQLRSLASQILSAQENERKRIALEVHDVLGSSLSAIKFKAEEAMLHLPKDGPSDISRPLEALIPLIQDTIEEARRIQSDLRPPLLDDLGIVPTLSWFCRRFETIYSGTKVEQAVAIPEEEVPDHLKIVLFRITQEAMHNIGKHAQADSVYLGLRKVKGAIELLIEDNGNGFDPESLSSREISKKGMGLSSMKERAEFSGGSFSIETVQGKGTVIRALWPV